MKHFVPFGCVRQIFLLQNYRVGIEGTYYDEVFAALEDEQSKTSIRTIQDITNLFTNFAKIDSNTDLGFQPIQNGQVNFMDFTNQGMISGKDPNGKAMAFWANLEQEMQPYIQK